MQLPFVESARISQKARQGIPILALARLLGDKLLEHGIGRIESVTRVLIFVHIATELPDAAPGPSHAKAGLSGDCGLEWDPLVEVDGILQNLAPQRADAGNVVQLFG